MLHTTTTMKKTRTNEINIDGEYEEDEEEENGNTPSWHHSNKQQNQESASINNKVLPKRANKNRPTEVTSRKAVSRHRQVVDLPIKKARDPRFDTLSGGQFREDVFKRNYEFIREYEASEVDLIKQQAKDKERDPKEREKLEKLVQRMVSFEETRQAKERRNRIERDWKKAEMDAVLKKGKKPYFLKKSDVNKLELVEKYQSLKPAERDRALERRRKKNATKEHRHVPYARRSAPNSDPNH